jgi:hypothetical protein
MTSNRPGLVRVKPVFDLSRFLDMRPDALSQPQLPLREVVVTDELRRDLPADTPIMAYRLGECTVIVTRDRGVEWHLSITHHSRYPTWDEIAQARYRCLPDDIWVAMYLPPASDYVNVHPNCFQLHEIAAPQEYSV